MPKQCKLCHQIRELRNSHIIPELCYLAAYDPLHRAQKFEADAGKRRLIQKGLREYLLCDDCEGKLSKWENQFKQYWYSTPALPQTVPPGPVTIRGFDYAAFKLFHLSILWRASVASSDNFNTVSLGTHEEKIRQVLLSANPGPEHHYPLVGQVLTDEKARVAYGLVGKPQRSELEGKQAYYTAYAGVEWCFIVTDDPPSATIASLLVHVPKTSGDMVFDQTPVEGSSTVKIFAEQYQGDPRKS